MPLCPQITNTPIVLPREVAITAVTYTSTTATYTASGHTFVAGNVVIITGLLPTGYNGTFTVASISGSTFTVSNTTNAAVTDGSGTATPAGDYVVSAVIPVIAATTTQVNTAQTNASAALAAANTAYTTAINSLQPSAYAIQNPTTKQLSAIDATGLTVYVNSPTAGARVVLNSLGLAGYNSGGSATFSISAATGAAVFSGSVTGSTITGGTLNIAGNAIIDASGFLTATGATVTGAINATSGYIGSAANGWNFSSSGFLTNAGGSTILYPTTSPGGNSTTYSIYTDRGVYAERVYVTNTTASSVFTLGGLYANGSVISGAGAFTANSSGAITAVTSITASGAITTSSNISTSSTGTITAAGNMTASAYLINSGIAIQNGTAVHILTGGRLVQSTSSERFKKNIVAIPEGGWLDKVVQIRPVNFQYDEAYCEAPEEIISGLIAEDIAEIPGFEHLLYNDPLGDPFSLSYERLTVFLVMAIKELKTEIDILKGE